MKLEDRMENLIAQYQGFVVLRSDFRPLGVSESQVGRALRKLIERDVIQRISHGAYVKTRINRFTNEPTPAAPLETVARELFQRLNVEITSPPEVEEYNLGLSSQVPAGCAVVVKGRRITRKVTVAGRTIRYA